MRWPNDQYYEGDFFNNLKEGNGTYVFNNRKKYIGEWKNDKMHGCGEIVNKSKTLKGLWENEVLVSQIED